MRNTTIVFAIVILVTSASFAVYWFTSTGLTKPLPFSPIDWVKNNETIPLELIDAHPAISVTRSPLVNSDYFVASFADVLEKEGIQKMVVTITDTPQTYNSTSGTIDNLNVTYSGFSANKIEPDTLAIDVYINANYFQSGQGDPKALSSVIELNIFQALVLVEHAYTKISAMDIANLGIKAKQTAEAKGYYQAFGVAFENN